MKRVIKTLAVLLLAAMPVFGAAQEKKVLRQTLEIAEVEHEDGGPTSVVFSMPEDGRQHYYLSVGTLGFGDDLIQFNFDPLFELFIPLGDTLEEAQARMDELKALAKRPSGATIVTDGCLAVGYPNDKLEPVTISAHKVLLERKLMFSVSRGTYIRATYIPRTDIAALAGGIKIYRKLHPKEK